MTPAQIAGLMNAISRISTVAKSQQRDALLDLSHIAKPILKHCQVKDICIILNALARKNVRNDKRLFQQASQMLVSNRKMAMNPQDLATVANAFARVHHHSPKLFEVIAEQSIPQIQDFSPQGLANLVNAFSKQNHQDSRLLFEAVANETEAILLKQRTAFTPQGLANIANAFAKMNHSNPKLFGAIANAAIPCIHEFNPQNLSNMANAFSKMDQHRDELFDAISKAALDKLLVFNAQELANLASASFKHQLVAPDVTSTLIPQLLQEIARAAIPILSTFKPQELAMLLNALTTKALLPSDTHTFWKASADATIALLPQFPPQELCIVANAFSKAPRSNYQIELFDKIAVAALKLMLDEKYDFQPQNLSNLANAFAKVNFAPDLLFQALMERAIPLLPQKMSPQELANLISAVSKLRIEGQLVDHLFAQTAELLLLHNKTKKSESSNNVSNLASWEQRNLVEVAYAFLKAFQMEDSLLERIGSEIASRPTLELDAVGLGHLAAVLSRTPRIEPSAELLTSIFASFQQIPEDSIQISNVADVCKALPLAYELEVVGSQEENGHRFLELLVEYAIRKRHEATPADVRDLLLNLTSPRLNTNHVDDVEASSSNSNAIVELQRSLFVAYQPILDQYSDTIAPKHVKTIRRAYKRLHVAAWWKKAKTQK